MAAPQLAWIVPYRVNYFMVKQREKQEKLETVDYL